MTPSSGWRTTRWALPAIPKGVTAVSVGVALTGEGSVTVDHLDLRTS